MTNPDDMTSEEMVRYLAVEVMEWADVVMLPMPNRTDSVWGAYSRDFQELNRLSPWNPLTDANDLWGKGMLVKTLFAKEWCLRIEIRPDGVRFARFKNEVCQSFYAYADTINTAICRATVKAVMESKTR